ncbi:STM3941 family protein [Flavitalea sp. BT771]|uniref:STM3941 family protein n=1 Tax=Flavitalea sp. BT771 TaxID=3063329 RepID=UPI0026E3D895|nr:STM3941 family protein [Flavitalea sp. BT771]MDO6431708.1 STM3941 family protein [Flavitalea sp. BT771]MDV6220616.1 STM3941 family protein [Flavitalea sp. BT771]
MTEHVEIPLNKKKLTLMLFGSLGFVIIGCWFIIKPPVIENAFLGDPAVIRVAGVLSVLFFGIVAFTLVRKLPDNRPGLIIDDQGITDNSSGVSAGLVLWEDVLEIKISTVYKNRFIMIVVRNPEEYIDRQTNLIKRKAMALNHRSYGSPISISANGLNANFDELYGIIRRQFGSRVSH